MLQRMKSPVDRSDDAEYGRRDTETPKEARSHLLVLSWGTAESTFLKYSERDELRGIPCSLRSSCRRTVIGWSRTMLQRMSLASVYPFPRKCRRSFNARSTPYYTVRRIVDEINSGRPVVDEISLA